MRHAVSIGIATLCLIGSRAEGEQKPGIEELAWMAGTWAGADGEKRMEEHWTAAAGGMMLGLHRDVAGGKAAFEFLRIAETPAGVVYFASPQGKAATPFELIEVSSRRAVFANPEHDFPQRILYWRDREALCAAVEGRLGEETVREEWCWKPAALAGG